jgi:hypothetical protein
MRRPSQRAGGILDVRVRQQIGWCYGTCGAYATGRTFDLPSYPNLRALFNDYDEFRPDGLSVRGS